MKDDHIERLTWEAWSRSNDLYQEIEKGISQELIYSTSKEIDDCIAVLALAKLELDKQKN